MAKAKIKPIHLVRLGYNCTCRAVCDRHYRVIPIEAFIKADNIDHFAKGTFNPKKVTCKRCLKHPDYKLAMNKVNNPLFYWRENI